MYKEDYKIVIQFDKNGELYWDVYKKGEPHFIGNNVSELVFIRTACEEVVKHIKRLQHEANKHQ